MGARHELLRLTRWIGEPLGHGVGRALLFLLIAVLNPFDMVQWSERHSHDMWQRLYAHCYETWQPRLHIPCGKSASAEASVARDATIVVYLDEDALGAMGLSRPLNPFEIQLLIDDLAAPPPGPERPLGIFVDLLLTDIAPRGATAEGLLASTARERETCAHFDAVRDRALAFVCLLARVRELTHYDAWSEHAQCQASTLAKLACIREKNGIPLLFADPREPVPAKGEERPSSPALDALGVVAVTVPVGIDPEHYELAFPATRREREHRKFALTPAAALYALWCDGRHTAACEGAIEKDDFGARAWTSAFDAPIDVIWGIGDSNPFRKIVERHTGGALDQQCRPAERGFGATVWHFVRFTVLGVQEGGMPSCLYANAVPADFLQRQIDADEWRTLFSGKIVMLGGQFADSNDQIAAAPFGTVPGVYYHAMALDNLIARGKDYPKPAAQVIRGMTLSYGDIASFAMLIGLGTLIEAACKLMASPPAGAGVPANRTVGRELWRRLAIVLCSALLCAAAIAVVTGLSVLLPDRFNLVAGVLLCVAGAGEIMWAAVAPVRQRLAERLNLARLWWLVTSETLDHADVTNQPKEQAGEDVARAVTASGERAGAGEDRQVPAG